MHTFEVMWQLFYECMLELFTDKTRVTVNYKLTHCWWWWW